MIRKKLKKLFPSKSEITEFPLVNRSRSLFFVHIPKTAGSSFRSSFENEYVTFKDYGNGSNSTTEQVQKNVYDKKDFFSLKEHINKNQTVWLAGHVHLAKYIDFIPISNSITFVREPLEQVLSHYNHYVKHHGFEENFEQFLDKPFARNLQSKFLKFMPLGLIGCVGITEHYDESLALINSQFGLALPSKKINVNQAKQFTESAIDECIKAKFLKYNQLDMAMYKEAVFLHTQRIALHKDNKAWTFACVAINQNNTLHGCAFQYESDKPVLLSVKLNNQLLKTFEANDFYGGFVKANFPRERYIAFKLPLPKSLTASDEIDVYVEETGQKLNFEPLTVKSKAV